MPSRLYNRLSNGHRHLPTKADVLETRSQRQVYMTKLRIVSVSVVRAENFFETVAEMLQIRIAIVGAAIPPPDRTY